MTAVPLSGNAVLPARLHARQNFDLQIDARIAARTREMNMVYDRSLTNRSRRTDCFSRMELSNIPAESVCNYYLFPVYRPHLLKQPLKSHRQGISFIYFLLESTCSSGPRPVHSNVPAAGFRDKQTEKGTPVFFVADSAFPSRIAHSRGETRDAGRASNRACRICRQCIESVAATPAARPDPHALPHPPRCDILTRKKTAPV